jgi:hypothetical protein
VAAKLRVLDVSDCWNLSNINIVRNCVQLRCLWMPGCHRVYSLSPLAARGETLEELWMASVVVSLSPLKACTRLRKLDLHGCGPVLHDQVEDLRLICTHLADPASVELEGLVHELQPNMPPEAQEEAANDIIGMTYEGDLDAQTAIADAGAIPALVLLLGRESSAKLQEVAAGALRHLAAGNFHNAVGNIIADAGAIPALVHLLRPDSPGPTQLEAAWALYNLASHAPNVAAIAATGAILALQHLLGSHHADVQEAAEAALDILGFQYD